MERNALISDVDAIGDDESAVVLTTLHGAKGLEFPVVFIVGLMEGVLPHQMSMDEGGVEEERRLCYVGMTRAKKRLYLSWSNTRGVRMGSRFDYFSAQRSRFLGEVPDGCLEQAAVRRTPAYHGSQHVRKSALSLNRGGVFTPAAKPEGRRSTHPPRFRRARSWSTPGSAAERSSRRTVRAMKRSRW